MDSMLLVGSIFLRKSSRYPLLGQATLDTSRRKDRKSRKYCRKPVRSTSGTTDEIAFDIECERSLVRATTCLRSPRQRVFVRRSDISALELFCVNGVQDYAEAEVLLEGCGIQFDMSHAEGNRKPSACSLNEHQAKGSLIEDPLFLIFREYEETGPLRRATAESVEGDRCALRVCPIASGPHPRSPHRPGRVLREANEWRALACWSFCGLHRRANRLSQMPNRDGDRLPGRQHRADQVSEHCGLFDRRADIVRSTCRPRIRLPA